MVIWLKRLGILILLGGLAGVPYLAMRETPVAVDLAVVELGPMTVTIDEEGETRIRDVYTVSAPIEGHLERTALEEGDQVIADETVIASIHPPDPPFLDERTRTQLDAAVKAAQSAVAVAQVALTRAKTNFNQADTQFKRTEKLTKSKVFPLSRLEQDFSNLELARAEVKSVQALIELRKAELASAQARLAQPGNVNQVPDGGDCCINITSPESGVVLKILARSERTVASGTKIAEIGDPKNLEVVVDIPSSDAPKIKPGTQVTISEWGGEEDLQAVVRRIDPAAFTKISSLGIEEQRVNAVLELNSVPDGLGHAYRVLARMVIWSGSDIVQIPIGAMFRANGAWSVFIVKDGRALLREISVGNMNNNNAQVTQGLEMGEEVVLYPSDLLENGSLIEER